MRRIPDVESSGSDSDLSCLELDQYGRECQSFLYELSKPIFSPLV